MIHCGNPYEEIEISWDEGAPNMIQHGYESKEWYLFVKLAVNYGSFHPKQMASSISLDPQVDPRI